MKRFFFAFVCKTRDKLDLTSVAFGGPGFSPADCELPLKRLQPLKLSRILALMFTAATALAGSPLLRAQQATPDKTSLGNAQNGKKNFSANGCYECHGLQGQGATQTGAARIGPPILPLEAFMAYVRHPANEMPPYSPKALSDQDLTDIYAYLKSIPLPPKGKDIPLLNK